MINVISRPTGYKLADPVLDAAVTDSGGVAIFTTAFSHALTTGNHVYIQSNVEAYNGFKTVDVLSATQFRIADQDSDTDFIQYYSDQYATYQVAIMGHGVVAAHNPIVYELESTLYPENVEGEAYVPAVVASHSNSNGYTQLTLSGNLEDATALAWIMIDGVAYQITSVISDSIVVINHAYDAADTFPGPVVKYYNNYCINVNVWSGYDAGHPWYAQKPYELFATLRLIPNDDNQVKFSISEIVRSAIITRNKLDLNTLPNNIDFSTGFYISYFETYDESDGLTVTTHTGSLTYDSLIGLAINAMMPFKGKYVSHMSEYINYQTYLAKWLVLQDRMTWIVGKFMDLSFIIASQLDNIDIYINGEVSQTISDAGFGVIRVPLTFDTAGEYCIQAYKQAIAARSASNLIRLFMLNCADGTWEEPNPPTLNFPQITLPSFGDSGYVYRDFTSNQGIAHGFTYEITITTGSATTTRVYMALMDSNCNVLAEDSNNHFTGGVITGSISLTPTADGSRLGIRVVNNTLISSRTYQLTDLDFTGSAGGPAEAITESYCIDVVAECDSTIIPDMDNIRLLEDGDFRILE